MEKNNTELHPQHTVGAGEAPAIILKHADRNDGDAALLAFRGHEGEIIVLTPEIEKKLLRKIDWNLMPVIGILQLELLSQS